MRATLTVMRNQLIDIVNAKWERQSYVEGNLFRALGELERAIDNLESREAEAAADLAWELEQSQKHEPACPF